jgi:hypothetical protein
MSLKTYEIPKEIQKEMHDSACNPFKERLKTTNHNDENTYSLPVILSNIIQSVCCVESNFGALRITGIPISNYDDRNNALMKSVSDLLGDAVGFSGEGNASMVQNLKPDKKDMHSQAGTGSKVNLEAHSDLAHLYPYNPDFLMLFCVNSGTGDLPKTTLFDINLLEKYLTKEKSDHLKNTDFQYYLPHSFQDDLSYGKNIFKPPLHQNGRQLESCFQFNTMQPTNIESLNILKEVKHIVDEKSDLISLQTGDLLIIKNKRMLHGRSAFNPIFSQNTRWLKRLYITKNIKQIQEFSHYQINSSRLFELISSEKSVSYEVEKVF